MKSNKNNIVVLIIIVMLCIFSLVLYLFFNGNEDIKVPTENIELVTSGEDEYILIQKLINNYYGYIQNKNKDELLVILDPIYVKENGITSDNITNIINTKYENIEFGIKDLKRYEHNNLYYYFANGYTIDTNFLSSNYEYKKDVNFMLIIDKLNSKYLVYPLSDNDYEGFIKSYDLSSEKTFVTKYNKEKISTTTKLSIYISRFKAMLKYDVDEAYNMLTNEAKQIINYNTFKTKADSINDKCSTNIFSYDYEKSNDSDIYYVVDKELKVITIYEQAPMDFKISLELSYYREELEQN